MFLAVLQIVVYTSISMFLGNRGMQWLFYLVIFGAPFVNSICNFTISYDDGAGNCNLFSSPCTSNQYQSQAPTATSDRFCGDVNVCTKDLTYQTAPPTLTTDRKCKVYTACDFKISYISVPGTTVTDLVCARITPCALPSSIIFPATINTNNICGFAFSFLYNLLNFDKEASNQVLAYQLKIIFTDWLKLASYTTITSDITTISISSVPAGAINGTQFDFAMLNASDLTTRTALLNWQQQGAKIIVALKDYRVSATSASSASSAASLSLIVIIVPCAVLVFVFIVWFFVVVRRYKLAKENREAENAHLERRAASVSQRQRNPPANVNGAPPPGFGALDPAISGNRVQNEKRQNFNNPAYRNAPSPGSRPKSSFETTDMDIMTKFADVPFFEVSAQEQEQIKRRSLEGRETPQDREIKRRMLLRSQGGQGQAVTDFSPIVGNAPGCPNTENPWHRCTNWCVVTWAHLVSRDSKSSLQSNDSLPDDQTDFVGPSVPKMSVGYIDVENTDAKRLSTGSNSSLQMNFTPAPVDFAEISAIDIYDPVSFLAATEMLEDVRGPKWSQQTAEDHSDNYDARGGKRLSGYDESEVKGGYVKVVASESGYFDVASHPDPNEF